jgi:putative phosphoesterase
MKTIAVFGDIHGNLPALKAVLDDMESRGYDQRYCLGDLVGYGTNPNEVIDIIREQRIPTISGNYDDGVGRNSDDCGCAYKTKQARELGNRSIAWTNRNTSEQNKYFLRSLPFSQTIDLEGLRILLVHGSPRKVNEYLYEDRPERSVERLFENSDVDVIICGHTHLPYHRKLSNGKQIINAGSVGKPKDGDPRAGYIVVSVEDQELIVEFIRVTYDVEKAAKAIELSEMPTEFAELLRFGAG